MAGGGSVLYLFIVDGVEMAIIAISRGTFAGARKLAEAVANKFDVPCVSREKVVARAATKHGVSKGLLAESVEQPPSMFERFTKDRDTYLMLLRATLCEQASEGSFVYHGHHAQHLLSDVPCVLRVRIVAPMEYRVAAVMDDQGLGERQARQHITRVTKQRARWSNFLYGVKWDDPSLYDLTLNLERLSVDEACEVVCNVASLPHFQLTDKVLSQVKDAALGSRVRAALAQAGELHGQDLEVGVEAGVITLDGRRRHEEERDSVGELVRSVPGVVRCSNRVRVPSDWLHE